jgi:hypothetical protein
MSYFEEIPLELDDKWRQSINRRFQTHGHLNIGLFRKSKNQAREPVPAKGAALRPSLTTIPVPEGVRRVSSEAVLKTQYGKLEIAYRTSPQPSADKMRQGKSD